uniref:Uncharacterized protein n=1 Tax=Mimiviridae sp. ChoanoV1 TaxID=2596887 RepID=A0A5B8IGC3_9VIRU|nr:hypothetical protein 4_27 [Mimiviridae sp. ChoanoV1]
MISKRCQGLNLINHLKQKYECDISFELIKDRYNEFWLTKFEFNNKIYEVFTNSKKEGIKKIMDVAYEDIQKNIEIKE